MNTGPSKAFQSYCETRKQHWDTIADSHDRNGLSHVYHTKLQVLYQNIVPKGSSILEIGCGKGDLLASLEPDRGVGVDFSQKMLNHAQRAYPSMKFILAEAHDLSLLETTFDVIIFSDLLNDLWDVQSFLDQLQGFCTPSTRIIFNCHSQLWELPLRLAQRLGLATTMLPQNRLTIGDIRGLLHLTGFEVVSFSREILFPLPVPLMAALCNRYLAKLKPFSYLNLTNLVVARPLPAPRLNELKPTVSVIIPARNEAGNIAGLLERVPRMGSATEIIFVEGDSCDNTYQTIVEEIANRPEMNARVLRQTGTGKGDAVRMGFEQAHGDIVMILDADMTVAPEYLTKFYLALYERRGEFINGVRLVYPMHEKAMRFFNLIANKFFSMAFTWLLGQPVKDTLCGTKALWRSDYQRLAAQRSSFGILDPFGDFDLLFGATLLNLKTIDLPVRYDERTYGTTNISRWSHGWLLFRMIITAARKLKFI